MPDASAQPSLLIAKAKPARPELHYCIKATVNAITEVQSRIDLRTWYEDRVCNVDLFAGVTTLL